MKYTLQFRGHESLPPLCSNCTNDVRNYRVSRQILARYGRACFLGHKESVFGLGAAVII